MGAFIRGGWVPGVVQINDPAWSLTIELFCYAAFFLGTAFLPKTITTRGIYHWFWIALGLGYCLWIDITHSNRKINTTFIQFWFGLGQFHFGCVLSDYNSKLILWFDSLLLWVHSLVSPFQHQRSGYSTLMSQNSNVDEMNRVSYGVKRARTILCFLMEATILALMVYSIGFMTSAETKMPTPFTLLYWVYCPLFVLFATLHADEVYRAWMKKVAKFMGEISLSIYLWHLLGVEIIAAIFGTAWFNTSPYTFPIFLVATIVFTAASYPIYRYYEMPAQNWLRTKLLPTPPPKSPPSNPTTIANDKPISSSDDEFDVERSSSSSDSTIASVEGEVGLQVGRDEDDYFVTMDPLKIGQ